MLTFPLNEVPTALAFKFDGRLDQEGIVGHHFVEVVRVVCFLDVQADVVQSARSDVSTRPLELIDPLLHLCPVFLCDTFGCLAHAHDEGHDFELLQHGEEDGFLSAQVIEGRDQIHG